MENLANIKYVVIGGSAGSFRVVMKILNSLPKDFAPAIIMCLHRLKHVRSGFTEALEIKSTIPVIEPTDKSHVKAGKIYLAPANYHLQVELGNHFSLSTADNVNHSRPSIDITFDTTARVFRNKMVGILLSGANKDGAKGLKQVKANGGITIVQDPASSQVATMPQAALNIFAPTHVLNETQIINFLNKIHNVQNQKL